jgi:DNA-binding NarL/FixJ family response regulator
MPRPIRALIIEDDRLIQQMLARLLRRTYDTPEFVVVDNADRAITELKNSMFDGHFDLIISDYNLVGPKTGGDVFAWIKEQDEPEWIDRFLFFSATDEIDLRKLHYQVLAKPASVGALRMEILAITGTR